MNIEEIIEDEAKKEGSCILEEPDKLHLPNEVYGGKFHDTYLGGKRDGKIEFARKLLKEIEK